MRVLAFSGGKDSMACLHLLRDTLDCAIFVDTGKTFPETQQMVEYASTIVPVVIVQTDQAAQNAREGIPSDVVPINWTKLGQMVTMPKPIMVQSYLSCCLENIAYPLIYKAKELKADEIVYGQRNEEKHKSTARNGDVMEGMVRIHPIEDWTREQVLDYLATKMEVPVHFHFSHSSLDCYDCTAYWGDTKDVVAFAKRRYPAFYEAYLQRLKALNFALSEELIGGKVK
jgi:3'-phosphoadenosine 5'-phosphosulfate sulfotransferase (PAPS reductase)/FAD synthetase